MITHIGNKEHGVCRIHKCATCDNLVHVHMTEETYKKVVNREDLIQNVIPNSDVVTREFFVTGMCEECQDKMFDHNDEEII